MGPDSELDGLQAEFPDWDITRIFGGFLAVPKGTPIVLATFTDTMAEKLKERG